VSRRQLLICAGHPFCSDLLSGVYDSCGRFFRRRLAASPDDPSAAPAPSTPPEQRSGTH
jgi:hypothetical protein